MEKGLVSIITPCYNTGKYVHRLLNSILTQDYLKLEVIAVDDGSTDNTLEVLESFKASFLSHNIPYTVYKQDNGGQSVAINNALKMVRGEFLMWPDSDDFYNRNDAISLLVSTFRRLPNDYGMIKTLPMFVRERNLEEIKREYTINKSENQFEPALFDKGFIWPPGLNMISIEALDATNPGREIYTEKRAGQNWQIILPLLYTYKCYTLEEVLFSVLVRQQSHSRQVSWNYSPQIEINDVYERTILNTLDRIIKMPEEERDKYKKDIRLKYARQRLFLSCAFGDKEKAREFRKEILKMGKSLTIKEQLKYSLLRMDLYPFNRPK